MEGMEAEGGRTRMFGLYLVGLRLSAVGKGTVFMSLRYANLAGMGSWRGGRKNNFQKGDTLKVAKRKLCNLRRDERWQVVDADQGICSQLDGGRQDTDGKSRLA